jgi:hypothetical protein
MLFRQTLIALAAAATAACAGRTIPATLDPPAADHAVEETAPDRARRIIFDWRMLDGEARFSGRGVARIRPPYHARLDLFGPGDETVLAAALVDQDLRLPPGSPSVPLPPAAMMWAVLGAVVPPDGATLVGTRVEEGDTELFYALGEEQLWYRLEQGRLAAVSWEGKGRRMNVELSGQAAGRLPSDAVFRDWSGYTELRISVDQVEDVDAFPEDIWRPGG